MTKTHRGLGAVVGTVFLAAVVIGALSYISYSIDVMGNFSESIIAEESRQRDIQDEKFELVTVDVDSVSDKLDATLKNTGEIPLKITTMYLDKLGDNTDAVQKIEIDQTIAPGNSFDFLSENIDVDIEPGEGYSMKLVTSRGESQTFYLNSASQEPLDIRLIASPNRIPTGFTTTIMMVVVNNMSNNNPLVNLTPIEPNCAGICNRITGPIPTSYDKLEPGDIAMFRWVYELDGNDDQEVTFESGIENGIPGNTASETVTITAVQVSELAGQSIDSLGFGQSELSNDMFLLHLETYGVPEAADPLPGAIPTPIHNYELNGDATDDMGGTDLQLSGAGGTLTATGWDFTSANKAQIVSGEIPNVDYAIEMVFSFDDTDAWIRLLDWHNHQGGFGYDNTEYGLYVQGDKFNFYDSIGTGTAGTFSDGTLTHVIIQRDSSTGDFEIYQDGSLVMTFNDWGGGIGKQEATFRGTDSENTSEQPATFFKDNGGEDSPGFVDCIRIFDEAFSSANAITVTTDTDTCYPFEGSGQIYQMNPVTPDSSGITLPLSNTNHVYQWFSANTTSGDTVISAGNWNASLRYNHAALPSELDMADIGMKLHFEETNTSTGIYDSGNDSNCYNLAESGNSGISGGTWHSDRGVNGSAAYEFNGSTDITIQIDGKEAGCLNIHHQDYSVSGWFNATINDDNDNAQFIIAVQDTSGDGGGFQVKVGDSGENSRGQVTFRNIDDDGNNLYCRGDEPDGNGGRNYVDGQWHHFVATMSGTECNLYVDGVLKHTATGGGDGAHWDMDAMDEDYHIGIDKWGGQGFTGYLDDIMFWYDLEMSQAQVTALKNFSFGKNATNLNFQLNNATGAGDTIDVLDVETNVGMMWGDPHRRLNTEDIWIGSNATMTLPQVGLKIADPYNRLNFTISYASGEPLNLRIDDSDLDSTVLLNSYLQTPSADPELPFYRTYDNDNKITFYTYNGEDEGVWFTYQGTRMVFNGTGGHYTAVVDTVDNGLTAGTLSVDADSPFVDKDVGADIVFWHPQAIPTAAVASTPNKITPGVYDVFVYLNGYDEDGSIFVRSIALGSVQVVE